MELGMITAFVGAGKEPQETGAHSNRVISQSPVQTASPDPSLKSNELVFSDLGHIRDSAANSGLGVVSAV